MLKNRNYICLDLETTGLDVQKDEPIQIGILNFDKNFQIQNHYKSYICPDKDINQLKKIVGFITWLEYQDLENAPKIQQVLPEIEKIFKPNSVIIGHNIQFDIDILSKYYDLPAYQTVDTFDLSKTLLHFISSHSLEIINKIINFEDNLKEIKEKNNLKNIGEAHDALYDSLASYNLFKYSIEKIEKLIDNYPIISNYINQSNSIYNDILNLPSYNKPSNQKLFLPALDKTIQKNKKVYAKDPYDLTEYDDFSKLYIGNQNIKQLLPKLLNPNKKYILTFDSYHKVKLIEKILKNSNIDDVSFLNKKPNLDPDKINKFLSQDNFQEFEINFILKYYSHFDNDYSILDLNRYKDYTIFHLLKQPDPKRNLSNFVLTTHDSLFNKLENLDLSEYTLLFFDWDWWYHSFKNYANQPFDLHYIVYFVDKLKYKQKVLHGKDSTQYETVKEFDSFFQIFGAVLFMEITKKFKWNNNYKIEINPIIDNIDFRKTNNLLPRLSSLLKKLKKTLNQTEYSKLKEMVLNLYNLLDEIVLVQQKMYDKDKFYFLFHHTNNVINYQTFLDNLEDNQTYFLTNQTKENATILDKNKTIQTNPDIKKLKKPKDILKYTDQDNIYIFSMKKRASKELFEYLIDNDLQQDFDILIQNITGSHGKNTYYGKKSNKKIMVGNQDFYYDCLESDIQFDQICNYKTAWSIEQKIFNDLKYYTI